jgi:hypothetical protein
MTSSTNSIGSSRGAHSTVARRPYELASKQWLPDSIATRSISDSAMAQHSFQKPSRTSTRRRPWQSARSKRSRGSVGGSPRRCLVGRDARREGSSVLDRESGRRQRSHAKGSRCSCHATRARTAQRTRPGCLGGIACGVGRVLRQPSAVPEDDARTAARVARPPTTRDLSRGRRHTRLLTLGVATAGPSTRAFTGTRRRHRPQITACRCEDRPLSFQHREHPVSVNGGPAPGCGSVDARSSVRVLPSSIHVLHNICYRALTGREAGRPSHVERPQQRSASPRAWPLREIAAPTVCCAGTSQRVGVCDATARSTARARQRSADIMIRVEGQP